MVPTDRSHVIQHDGNHTHTAQCLPELVEYAQAARTAHKLAEDAQWAVFHHLLMAGTPITDLLPSITHTAPDPEDIDWYLKDYRRWLNRTPVRERHPGRRVHTNAKSYLNYLSNNA